MSSHNYHTCMDVYHVSPVDPCRHNCHLSWCHVHVSLLSLRKSKNVDDVRRNCQLS